MLDTDQSISVSKHPSTSFCSIAFVMAYGITAQIQFSVTEKPSHYKRLNKFVLQVSTTLRIILYIMIHQLRKAS
jgi:hypothetical protein